MTGHGLRESEPSFSQFLFSIDFPISVPNCRLHVVDLGAFNYLRNYFFQLSPKGEKGLKSLKHSVKMPKRLNDFWKKNLTGCDVEMLMENLIQIINFLTESEENFNSKLLNELELMSQDFFLQDFDVNNPLEFVKLVFYQFYDVYYCLKEPRSNRKIESIVQQKIYLFRKIMYKCGLSKVFKVPKNHFMDELTNDRLVHGPCLFFETSPFESTHHIHREGGTSKNKRFLTENIIISQASRILLNHLMDGGFLEETTKTENVFRKSLEEIEFKIVEEKEKKNPKWYREKGNPGIIDGFKVQNYVKKCVKLEKIVIK